ncbi:MAG: SPFH domain-containing protein [Candidatus Bathyarchaeia archaeon]
MPFERLRKILGKERILTWDHAKHPGIVWRFPDTSSDDEKERDPNKIDAFQVKVGERAVALINNEFYEDTPPGTYWLKGEQKKGLEIIFVSEGQMREPWGIPGNILTKDDQQIGAHGFHVFKITDPKAFVLNIVSAQKAYTSEQVNDFIRGHVSNLLRQHLTNYTVLDGQVLREQEAFTLAMKAKCQEMFSRWGLELINLEVEIYVPDELRQVIEDRSRVRQEMLLTDHLEIRRGLEERKLEAQKAIELKKIEVEATKDLMKIKADQERELSLAQLNRIKKESQRDLQSLDVDIEKLKAMITDIVAGETERSGKAQALVTELTKKAELAGELFKQTTEAELRIKELEAKSKAETELEKVKALKEIEVARAKAEAEIAERERQIIALRELGEVMARMAEAVAIGGQEGEAIRKGLEEKFATLLAEAGINVPKYIQAKAMEKTPPKPYIKIDKEVTKEEEKTKRCPNCGRKLAEDAKFCDACGTKQ